MINLGSAIHRVLTGYAGEEDFALVPVDVEVVRRVVCAFSQVDEITIRRVKLKTKHILGQVRFTRFAQGYGDTRLLADIYLSNGLNDCWRRFVAAKEIMHCVLDQEDHDFVKSLDAAKALAEGLVNSLITGVLAQDGPQTTEMMAEVMAAEVLFPLEHREHYVERYREGLLTDMQLATRFKIPESVVRSSMAPRYLDAVQKIRTQRVAIQDAKRLL